MPHRFRFSLLFALLISVLLPSAAAPHPGGLDSFGCHHEPDRRGYHCHRGQFAGQSFASRQAMRGALIRSAQPEPPKQEGTPVLTPHVTPPVVPQPSAPGQERACIREDKSKEVMCGEVVE